MSIVVQKNFLTEQEIKFISDYIRLLTEEDQWQFRLDPKFSTPSFLNLNNENEPIPNNDLSIEMGHFIETIKNRMFKFLSENFSNGSSQKLDLMSLTRWHEGDYQLPHADSAAIGGGSHPYPWREYAALLYLNDDYEGGNIYFPNQEKVLTPAAGTLVAFPGTLEYLHGVIPVEYRHRYTIATFWGSNLYFRGTENAEQ